MNRHTVRVLVAIVALYNSLIVCKQCKLESTPCGIKRSQGIERMKRANSKTWTFWTNCVSMMLDNSLGRHLCHYQMFDKSLGFQRSCLIGVYGEHESHREPTAFNLIWLLNKYFHFNLFHRFTLGVSTVTMQVFVS